MLTSRAGKYSKTSGFTLVELTVVILILGIGLGMMTPYIDLDFFGNDFKTSLRRLQGIVNELRYEAMISKKAHTLTIEFSNKEQDSKSRYWISTNNTKKESENKKQEERNKRDLFKNDARLVAVKIMNQSPKTSGQANIRFLPKGMVQPSKLIVNSKGEKYVITIQSFSPKILVDKGIGQEEAMAGEN